MVLDLHRCLLCFLLDGVFWFKRWFWLTACQLITKYLEYKHTFPEFSIAFRFHPHTWHPFKSSPVDLQFRSLPCISLQRFPFIQKSPHNLCLQTAECLPAWTYPRDQRKRWPWKCCEQTKWAARLPQRWVSTILADNCTWLVTVIVFHYSLMWGLGKQGRDGVDQG